MQDFGKLLRHYRTERGLTLRGFAKLSGYSYSYLANIEAGRKTPRLFTMNCLMKALSLKAGYFVHNAEISTHGTVHWIEALSLRNEVTEFISNQDPWFRLSIPDASWLLSVKESEVRKVISDLRLIAPPKVKFPDDGETRKGNLFFFYTTTPYFVFRDELLILAEVLDCCTLPVGRGFERRMKSIRAGFADIDAAIKQLRVWDSLHSARHVVCAGKSFR